MEKINHKSECKDGEEVTVIRAASTVLIQSSPAERNRVSVCHGRLAAALQRCPVQAPAVQPRVRGPGTLNTAPSSRLPGVQPTGDRHHYHRRERSASPNSSGSGPVDMVLPSL